MNEKMNFASEIAAGAPHPDRGSEIAEILRSALTPKPMKERLLGYHERDIAAASKIGDDYLQRKATGREVPDSFNHGRSAQRVAWLKKGLATGDPLQGDTFTPAYEDL